MYVLYCYSTTVHKFEIASYNWTEYTYICNTKYLSGSKEFLIYLTFKNKWQTSVRLWFHLSKLPVSNRRIPHSKFHLFIYTYSCPSSIKYCSIFYRIKECKYRSSKCNSFWNSKGIMLKRRIDNLKINII